jgi:adenosylcobinamide-GDP ribazoletransferase
MKPIILAVQFMTRLPLPNIAAGPQDMAKSIRYFPLAGLIVGLSITTAAWIGLHRDPWAAALLALLTWVTITGALHLDGLGDIADAAGAGHADRARVSAVLADPHIGSFGVTAITLQLAAKLVLLRLALDAPLALIAIPAIARIAPLYWTLTLPPLHEGLGRMFGAGACPLALTAWLLPLVTAAYLISPALLAAIPAAILWSAWLKRRIGGISGDGHGAGIELLETALLATLAFTL